MERAPAVIPFSASSNYPSCGLSAILRNSASRTGSAQQNNHSSLSKQSESSSHPLRQSMSEQVSNLAKMKYFFTTPMIAVVG